MLSCSILLFLFNLELQEIIRQLKSFLSVLISRAQKSKRKNSIELISEQAGQSDEQVAELIADLHILVKMAEGLSARKVNDAQMCHHYERILALTQEFDAKVAQMPTDDEEVNKLRAKMDALQIVAENVILELIPEINQPENGEQFLNENSNWHDITESDRLSYHEILGAPENMEVAAASASDPGSDKLAVLVAANEIADGENQAEALPQVENGLEQPNAQGSAETVNDASMQVDEPAEANENATAENRNGQVNVPQVGDRSQPQVQRTVSEAANEALASAVCTTFSYQSLVKFNHAINRLENLQVMPERAMGAHFRNLRNFITRFLALCQTLRIDIRFLEAVLISHVVATFNEMVFSNWKFSMRTHGASLTSIREFLTVQEEIATDEWMQESRLVLNSAVRAAQRMINDPAVPVASEPGKPAPPFKIPLLNKRENAKPAGENQGQSSYAKVAGEGEQPGCSHWSGGAWPKTTTPSSGNQTRNRDSSVDSGKGGKSADKKKGSDKKHNEKRCFYCGGKHLLFYCPQYISLSLRDRMNYIKDNLICPLCLQAHHDVSECTDGICTNCEEPHNSTLCPISIRKKLLQKKKRDQEKKE